MTRKKREIQAKITAEEARRATEGRMRACPFCGEIPEVAPWHGGAPRKIMIGCEGEDCLVLPSVTGETPDEALENWNRRDGGGSER